MSLNKPITYINCFLTCVIINMFNKKSLQKINGGTIIYLYFCYKNAL